MYVYILWSLRFGLLGFIGYPYLFCSFLLFTFVLHIRTTLIPLQEQLNTIFIQYWYIAVLFTQKFSSALCVKGESKGEYKDQNLHTIAKAYEHPEWDE